MIKPQTIHTKDAEQLKLLMDRTNAGWRNNMMIHDHMMSFPRKKTGLLERLVLRAVSILNFVLKPTGYKLVHRRHMMSRKMAAMSYCYGANKDDVYIELGR